MNDLEILDSIRNSGFPESPDLTDQEILNAIASVQMDLRYDYQQISFGLFTLNPNQQVYDLFSTTADVATSKGVFPGGVAVLELIWGAGTCGQDSIDVFGMAPWLQMGTLLPGGVSLFNFNTPSDWAIWDANWTAFTQRFGSQFFEHTTNAPGSPIRIFPLPTTTQTAWVRYKKYRALTEFQSTREDESSFITLVEANCCRVVARKLRMTAGTTIGSLKDDGKSALYWDTEANRKQREGQEYFKNHNYEVGVAAQRG